MKWLYKKVIQTIGFLFGNLIPLAAIILGGVFFVIFIPEYSVLLTAIWAVVVLVIDIRYSKRH
ncbi:hypothetical protein CUN67_06345 [Pantoea cypripedii]|uniref:Uncharacterized protein n=1 Tax=Pantoea cypripedii TaxID=55209 RepID=A0A6B9FXP7_PANCY|nr:hypothetical protein CUN67_06345 [Pantoea cypripedii]